MDLRDFMAMDFIKPCIIQSYNHTQGTCVVLTQPKRLNNGEAGEALLVTDIPVCFPRFDSGKGSITHPLKAGDAGLLLTCGRSIEEFMEGKVSAPEDPRVHDVNDSFFLPCMFVNNPINTDGTCIHLQYGKTEWRLYEDHRIEVDGDIIHKGNYTQTGDYTQTGNRTQMGAETLKGDRVVTGTTIQTGEIVANGIPVSTHLHMDTKQEKGSMSGKPTP